MYVAFAMQGATQWAHLLYVHTRRLISQSLAH